MTKKVYYIKEGRKYIPVAEYDSDLMDSFPKGNHLVQCYPGGSSRRFNVDAKLAPMIAAGRFAEDAISKEIMRASDLRPKRAPLTEGQRAAWQKLVEEFGPDAKTLEWPSAREVAEAGVNAMIAEAEKLMEHPMVKEAYDEFMAICKLVSENNK
jgi:roadblock/LC7 domain-containing protein